MIIDRIANELNIPVNEIREKNMYKEGDKTHFGQTLEKFWVKKLWDETLLKSNYKEKEKQVQLFNQENKFKKRGISVIPTKFGIAFTAV
jgi:xanthine dehydrogenase/oxidase